MFLIKPFSSLLGIFILIFIGWVFLAGIPSERIDRGCRPIGWAGNLTTSIFAIGAPSFSSATHRVFKNTEYACQYAIWRLVYEREWLVHQAEEMEAERDAARQIREQRLDTTLKSNQRATSATKGEPQ